MTSQVYDTRVARLLKTDYFIAQESSRSTCESDSLKCCCWRFALTNAKGSFESGKFTLKITCESGKLFTTECRLPHKSTNFETLLVAWLVWLVPIGCTRESRGGGGNPAMGPQSPERRNHKAPNFFKKWIGVHPKNSGLNPWRLEFSVLGVPKVGTPRQVAPPRPWIRPWPWPLTGSQKRSPAPQVTLFTMDGLAHSRPWARRCDRRPTVNSLYPMGAGCRAAPSLETMPASSSKKTYSYMRSKVYKVVHFYPSVLLTMDVESGGGGGRHVLPIDKSAGDVPPKFG